MLLEERVIIKVEGWWGLPLWGSTERIQLPRSLCTSTSPQIPSKQHLWSNASFLVSQSHATWFPTFPLQVWACCLSDPVWRSASLTCMSAAMHAGRLHGWSYQPGKPLPNLHVPSSHTLFSDTRYFLSTTSALTECYKYRKNPTNRKKRHQLFVYQEIITFTGSLLSSQANSSQFFMLISLYYALYLCKIMMYIFTYIYKYAYMHRRSILDRRNMVSEFVLKCS